MRFNATVEACVKLFMQRLTISEIRGDYSGGGDSGQLNDYEVKCLMHTQEQLEKIKVPLPTEQGSLNEYLHALDHNIVPEGAYTPYSPTALYACQLILYEVLDCCGYDLANNDGGNARLYVQLREVPDQEPELLIGASGEWYETVGNPFEVGFVPDNPDDSMPDEP